MTDNYSFPHKIIEVKCERLCAVLTLLIMKKKKTTLLKYAITSEIEKMARTTFFDLWNLEMSSRILPPTNRVHQIARQTCNSLPKISLSKKATKLNSC